MKTLGIKTTKDVPRYYKEVRFEHFRTFSEVARLGGFAQAGRALELSRPTVWQQVDSLERAFETKLFTRRGRGIELTDSGRLLLELIQPSVAAMEGIVDAFRARLTGRGETLRLAGVSDNDLLFRAIARFHKCRPQVRFSWIEQRSADVVRLVEDGECDLGIVLSAPEVSANPRVHYENCGRRSFTLVAPADHPLMRVRSLSLAQFADYPLITFPKDNGFRRYVDRILARKGVLERCRIAAEAETIETAEHCVRLGLGVALVLPSCTRTAPAKLKYRPLDKFFGYAPLQLVWKRGAHLPSYMQSFVTVVKELLPK